MLFRKLAAYCCVLFIGCSPHLNDTTSPTPPDTAGPMPDYGRSGSDNDTIDASTPAATHVDLTISGKGSVTLANTSFRPYLASSITLPNIALNGYSLAAKADPGYVFSGWFGPCDPTAKDHSQCRVLAPNQGTPEVTAVFGEQCSKDGWCIAHLPLPATATILKVIALANDRLALLGSDNTVYFVTADGVVDGVRSIFAAGSGIYATSMCLASTDTLLIPSQAGLVARVPLTGAVTNEYVGTLGVSWTQVSCGTNGTVCLSGSAGSIVCTSGLDKPWVRLDLSSLPGAVRTATFRTVYTTSSGWPLAAGDNGIFLGLIDNRPTTLSVSDAMAPTDTWFSSDGLTDDEVWFVGGNARVARVNRTSIRLVSVPPPSSGSGSTEYLTSVKAIPTNAVEPEMYAAGSNGLVVHCTGTTCQREDTGSRVWLSTITTTPQAIIACGALGTCLVKKRSF